MTTAGEITIELNGKDVNLSSLLIQVDQRAQKAADSSLRLQAQYARLANTQGNTAGATAILTNALQNNGGASEQALLGVANQLAGLQKGSTYFQEFGASAKSSLLGIVGPAAVAGAALTALSNTAQSFVEAFKFKAELDQNRASITAQLAGVRDSKAAFAEAAVFADKYKLTQAETTSAIQSSIPLLRESKSSLTDVLTVLAQLQVLKPEEGIKGAAFALAELQGGQVRSLATRFNIPISKANELKQEIAGGADAVKVLGAYLTNAGIGAAALEARTKGAAGAMADEARAAEELKLAQADFAQGPGLALLNERITLTRGLTRVLGGGGGLSEALNQVGAAWAGNTAYSEAYTGFRTLGESKALKPPG